MSTSSYNSAPVNGNGRQDSSTLQLQLLPAVSIDRWVRKGCVRRRLVKVGTLVAKNFHITLIFPALNGAVSVDDEPEQMIRLERTF